MEPNHFEPSYRPHPTTFSAFPRITKLLVAANVLLFGLQLAGLGDWLQQHFALWPAVRIPLEINGSIIRTEPNHFRLWQLITYGFLHGGLGHLLMNMIGLWMFGSSIENAWGAKRFLVFFLASIVGAAYIQQLIWLFISTPEVIRIGPAQVLVEHTVGASGGLFGLLLAFGMLFPNVRLVFIFLPFPIKAKWFVMIYGGVEFILGVSGLRTGVAHFAHLGGMVSGYLLIQFWRGKLPFKPRPGCLW